MNPLMQCAALLHGHTLKHLVAAAGVWFLVLMVRERAHKGVVTASTYL